MKNQNRNNQDGNRGKGRPSNSSKKTGRKPYGDNQRPSSKSRRGKFEGYSSSERKENKSAGDFSPLKKYSKDKPSFQRPENQDSSKEKGALKTVYKGRGKDQRPVFGTERVDEERNFQKSRKFKNNRFIKNNRDFQEEKPEYNLKKVERKLSKSSSSEIRLNKYIANSGICSRRDADKLIEKGEIKVNGEVITELGHRVSLTDKVVYKGKTINPEKPVYVLLNKPKDFITTTDDPMNRKTVMHLVQSACDERIFPVGRLDRNTTGLLLFTNDGELASKLSHPSEKIKKIYQVTLDKPIGKSEVEAILEGLTLEDGLVEVDDLQVLSKDRTILGIEIHVGKNRIVRRIFAHLGFEVVALDRVTYAGLTKKDLSRGQWRFLTEKEVINLKYFK
ncbi:rRNA pseudouridine synthase [Echinicola sp. CAU 1574]|uniref:Pseudouridine synthase n=1 Tax=Echinicola arenosa TaxID=2774144 RepID=A0ABR9AJA8_9BACT|nr:pseudouridine synthase [Echinicola arenosa]MBD8488417.1 rRNA pseudouridine synthase [Echinicola arenosa]